MTVQHSMWFDRVAGAQVGALTLQYSEVLPSGRVESYKIFNRLTVLSGQNGFLSEDWVAGKSPTPFGNYWMATKKVPLQMEPKGTPFYQIADKRGGTTIVGPDGQVRTAIGFHLDNDTPSTIGCVARPNKTTLDRCLNKAIFAYLDELSKTEPFIRFHVV